MKHRVRVQKDETPATPAGDATPTNRLTGISVNEVSIVDRAANKRKYLVVKEDALTVAKDAPAVPPPAAPTAPAPPTTPTPPAATLQISPELKAKVLGALKIAQERIGIISKVLEGSSETPGAAPPQELMDALQELVKILSPVAGPTVTPQPEIPAPTAPATKEDATPTEKSGRKMSAKRIEQLQSAKGVIDSLLADVTAEEAAEGGDDATSTEKKVVTEKADPASGGASATPAVDQKLDGILNGLSSTVSKMTTLFELQNKRIDELSKSRGGSQQPDLDAKPKPVQKQTIWEMDMAKPMRVTE